MNIKIHHKDCRATMITVWESFQQWCNVNHYSPEKIQKVLNMYEIMYSTDGSNLLLCGEYIKPYLDNIVQKHHRAIVR